MRFVVDANLPPRLVAVLSDRGHVADHVGSLDLSGSASDSDIARWADGHDAVVVSKDDDFRLLQLATRCPRKLLLIGTGNISNRDLVALFAANADVIESSLPTASCVELGRDSLTVFGDDD